MSCTLGIDLGGSSLKAAVIDDATGAVTAAAPIPTSSERGPTAVLDDIAALGRSLVGAAGGTERVGVALPGHFDPASGVGTLLPNLIGDWRGQPIREPLERAFGLPVHLINDAKAHCLAELRLGAGSGTQDLLFVAMGTGIGGALAIGGKLYLGTGHAGEIGHITAVAGGPACGCGNRGCLDRVASAAAIADLAGHESVVAAAAAARMGDTRAKSAFDEIGGHVGRVLAHAVVLFWPERVVIGGGVSTVGDLLLDPIRAELRLHVHMTPIDSVSVSAAALGVNAGAIGAAIWAADPSTAS
jgi:glucokinase